MTVDHDALPPGWTRAPLGDVADLALGKMLDKAKRTAGTPMPYLRNINVRWHSFDLSDVYEMPFESHEVERYSVREGDVLICEGGEPGRAAVWQGPAIMFQKAIHRVRPRADTFDPRWLVWHLRHDAATGRLAESFTGTTIKHLTGSALARYEIAMPPLAEQRRIVAKLDELLASSRAARAALDAVPALLEQYRQAVLAAAFRGDLTADWRGDGPNVGGEVPEAGGGYARRDGMPNLPASWSYMAVEEVAQRGTVVTYGIVLPGPEVPDGVPYVRQQDIEDGRIRVEALGRTSYEIAAKHSRSALQEGDVLLCIIRHLRVAIVPPGIDGANVTQGTVRIRPAPFITAPYLAAYLSGPAAQAWMKRCYIGMAMPRINVKDARAVPVAVPPLPEQHEIMRRVSAALQVVERQLASAREMLHGLDALEQTVLARAFRGELQPQAPTDEPASVLLDQLRSARAAAPSARRPRRVAAPT